jgi:endoglucanase
MTRREFITTSAAAAAAALLPSRLGADAPAGARPQPRIPRWRGFNFTEMNGWRHGGRPYRESDFEWMAGWGFNFARLPCAYVVWSDPKDWMSIDGDALKPLDQALEFGRQYGVHTCVSMNHVPGYSVNGSDHEPFKLFDSPRDSMLKALDAAVHQWKYLANRYRDVPSTRLSFDLLNEPPFMQDQSRYVEICKTLIRGIREVSPDRLIFANGADIGQTPVLGLIDEGIVQSSHDYQPKMVSHYTATWVPAREFESTAVPTWPMVDKNGVLWNKEKLRVEEIEKWKPLTDAGAPVHVGEWGCFSHTPRQACMGWMADQLSLWKEAGWGWALWNLRGNFGIVDSDRPGVTYENFQGHKLDREMLELLRAG